IVEMRVHMDCAGCESKIRKALKKLKGVDDVDVDLRMQRVTVTGWVDADKVLKTVRKTGKTAEFWPYPYNPEYHAFTHRYYHQLYPKTKSISYNDLPRTYTYNYYEHGYSGNDNGVYYQPVSSTFFDGPSSHMFSDDNTSACSIM
ncbi:Heavy metal-associated domain, HMA, partial [Dillenia turbinata]